MREVDPTAHAKGMQAALLLSTTAIDGMRRLIQVSKSDWSMELVVAHVVELSGFYGGRQSQLEVIVR